MSSIPVQFVDDDEFLAIEQALASASAASAARKRHRQEPNCSRLAAQQIREAAQTISDSTQIDRTHIGACIVDVATPKNNHIQIEKQVGESCLPDSQRDSKKDGGTPVRRLPLWPCGSRSRDVTSSIAQHQKSKQYTCDSPQANPLEGLLNREVSDGNQGVPWGFVRSDCRALTKCRLPTLQFKGRIIYSTTLSDAEEAARELLRLLESKKSVGADCVPLGFDTEWKVIFKRGIPYAGAPRRKVAVLQLCVDADRCNVFHVTHSGMPGPLQYILEDDSILKVGVGAYGDASKLRMDYNVSVKGVKDLCSLANMKLGGSDENTQLARNWSLSSLAQELLGKQVDKSGSIRTGDWEVNKLSMSQLQYAATDAFVSLYLFQVLMTFPDTPKKVASS